MLCIVTAALRTWMQRGNASVHIIPAPAGIQPQGTPWMPAGAGMTTRRRVPYVYEYITRSRQGGAQKTDGLSTVVQHTGGCIKAHDRRCTHQGTGHQQASGAAP